MFCDKLLSYPSFRRWTRPKNSVSGIFFDPRYVDLCLVHNFVFEGVFSNNRLQTVARVIVLVRCLVLTAQFCAFLYFAKLKLTTKGKCLCLEQLYQSREISFWAAKFNEFQ
ncbi:hypothetical protein Dimus_009105 [Dionaea muscipula]